MTEADLHFLRGRGSIEDENKKIWEEMRAQDEANRWFNRPLIYVGRPEPEYQPGPEYDWRAAETESLRARVAELQAQNGSLRAHAGQLEGELELADSLNVDLAAKVELAEYQAAANQRAANFVAAENALVASVVCHFTDGNRLSLDERMRLSRAARTGQGLEQVKAEIIAAHQGPAPIVQPVLPAPPPVEADAEAVELHRLTGTPYPIESITKFPALREELRAKASGLVPVQVPVKKEIKNEVFV